MDVKNRIAEREGEPVIVGKQVYELNSDGMLRTRPVCGVPGCNNPGFIYYGGMFVCGDCITKLHQKEIERQKIVLLEVCKENERS